MERFWRPFTRRHSALPAESPGRVRVNEGYRQFGWALLVCLAGMLLIREGNYHRAESVPLLLRYMGKFIGYASGLVFVLVFRLPRVPNGGLFYKKFFVWYGWFAVVVVLEHLLEPAFVYEYDISSYIMLFQWPLWGLIGYRVGILPGDALWLLRRFAFIFAAISVYSFFARLAGVSPGALYGPASWPVRLCVLFGLCWYLSEWINQTLPPMQAAAGLAACSLETIAVLQKPIVFAFGCSLIVVISTLVALQQRKKTALIRLSSLLIGVAALLVVTDVFSGGSLSRYVARTVVSQYLHTQEGELIPEGFEEISHAISGGRFDIWSDAWPRFFASPLVGAGIGQAAELTQESISLHNGYLDWLLSFGLLGFAPVVFLMCVWYRQIFLSCHRYSLLAIQLACLAYITAMLGFNVGGISRSFDSVSFFICLIVGLTWRLSLHASPNAKWADLEKPGRSG